MLTSILVTFEGFFAIKSLREPIYGVYYPVVMKMAAWALLAFFSSTLNTEYSIFIKQNKKIIIIKQLKTINLFFI
jgi:hypothetical protein